MSLEEQKKINQELFREEFRNRAIELSARPIQVDIETTTRCNLRCFTCPRTYNPERGKDASRELFERVAEALFATARSVNLTGYGEPMLSPHFEYFFDRSVQAGLEVGFITNGTLLTEQWLERFANAGVHLFLSVDAASGEVMSLMRPGLDFEKLKSHLEYWRRLHAGGGGRKSHLSFNFVPTRRNIHELPGVIRMAARSDAEVVEVLNFYTDDLPQDTVKAHLRNDPDLARKWFTRAREEAADHGIKLILPPGYENSVGVKSVEEMAKSCEAPLEVNPPGSKYPLACSAPWFRVNINMKGDVYPCCRYPYPMGNMVSEPFEAVWNGEACQKMRRRINTRFPHLGCKECELVWGITAGDPAEIFRREDVIDRLHTWLQRLRRRWSRIRQKG